MASSGLRGPFPLTHQGINDNVNKTFPGTYTLGKIKIPTYYIARVGRSDDDVNRRLHDYIGDYEQFKFEYYPSPKAAFDKECLLYHDFKPPDNKIHPDRPSGTNWKCPVCDHFH